MRPLGCGRAAVTAARLVPRWYAAVVTTILAIMLVVFLAMGLTSSGLTAWAGLLSVAWCLLLLVAAVTALVLPRRRRTLAPGPDGATVVEAPATLVWSLVAAWGVLLAVAALWAVNLVADFTGVEASGPTLVAVLGALASLPDLLRLLTGRLHRWRLVLRDDGFTYRGYHTDVTLPWSKVHGARVQARGPAGVLIDRKGTGPDVVVPITALNLPAEQVIEEIERRRAGGRST